jgi:uncharacterized protein
MQVAGTKAGGRSAAETNKRKYGADLYGRIGALGGKKGRTGGFYANRELVRIAGAKGGRTKKASQYQDRGAGPHSQHHQQQSGPRHPPRTRRGRHDRTPVPIRGGAPVHRRLY